MEHYNDPEYLCHYGVLGMKWGMRKAAKKGQSYKYTSWNTNRHKNAAARLRNKAQSTNSAKRKAKLTSKANVRAKKAKASQQYDNLQVKYAKEKAHVGTSIAHDILSSGFVAQRNSYQRMRATGGTVVGSAVLAGIFGDAAGRMNKHKYIKKHSQ